mmetsp:Transcript_2616/g.4985  ORF Transcript_2616/g.4985 Transcript_2616/m.4985 type:complete len:822 (-) Transcript_2616:71-2536(-)
MSTNTTATTSTIVLIGKDKNVNNSNPFFSIVQQGCLAQAAKLSTENHVVECIYDGPENAYDPLEQAFVARKYIRNSAMNIQGLAISPSEDIIASMILQEANEAGIHTVTFDSDVDNANLRLAYIGTDNYALGKGLAKLVMQLKPEGGTFAIVSSSSPNLLKRNEGLRDALFYESDVSWTEVVNSPKDCMENNTLALQMVRDFALQSQEPVDVVVPIAGWPMFDRDAWAQMVDNVQSQEDSDTLFVVADTFEPQVQALVSGHVNGLVGQDAYKIGVLSVDILHQHCCTNDASAIYNQSQTVYGTELVEMVRVPLDLPPPLINNHYLGTLRILGFVFFGIAAVLSIAMGLWTFQKRSVRVVIVSQPGFLLLLCFGVLLFSSTLIPMSFDDENADYKTMDKMCMSIPWLASLGFTIMFAALFSKIWRINKIFKNPHPYSRMKVTGRDICVPFLILLSLNLINLAVWTAVAPLEFSREHHLGTDGWNRYISYYGTCTSPDATPFIVLLALINVSAVVLANWQAYEARSIQSEFAESKYIAIAMVAVLQALLTGVPILFLVRDDPQVYYVVMAIMVFVIGVAILLLVFVPKILAERRNAASMEKQKKKHVKDSMAQLKEKRYRFGSLFANDGSCTDAAEEAMANRRDFDRSKKKRDLAQEALDDDDSSPRIKRRFRRKWPRQDMSFKNDDEGMALERGDFEESGQRLSSTEPSAEQTTGHANNHDSSSANNNNSSYTTSSHMEYSVETPSIPGSVQNTTKDNNKNTATTKESNSTAAISPPQSPQSAIKNQEAKQDSNHKLLIVGIGPSFTENGAIDDNERGELEV